MLLDYTLYSDISQNSLISFSEMQNNAYVNITVAARSGVTQHLSKYSPNKQNDTPKNSQKSVGLPQTPKPITRTCNQFQPKHSILREELLPARDAQSNVQSTQSPPSTPPHTSTERQPDGTCCLVLSQTGPVPPTIKENLTAEAKSTKPQSLPAIRLHLKWSKTEAVLIRETIPAKKSPCLIRLSGPCRLSILSDVFGICQFSISKSRSFSPLYTFPLLHWPILSILRAHFSDNFLLLPFSLSPT